jgi:hypothetical protein
MIPVTSSFIHAIGYNAEKKTATVEFIRRSSSARAGSYSIYQYFGVKPVTFSRWLKAPSKGKYFHRNIRNRFGCKRIA